MFSHTMMDPKVQARDGIVKAFHRLIPGSIMGSSEADAATAASSAGADFVLSRSNQLLFAHPVYSSKKVHRSVGNGTPAGPCGKRPGQFGGIHSLAINFFALFPCDTEGFNTIRPPCVCHPLGEHNLGAAEAAIADHVGLSRMHGCSAWRTAVFHNCHFALIFI